MSTNLVSTALSTPTQHVLTVFFQGICAFIRNHQQPQNTNEVTAIFVAGERANENPPLCTHTPVLVFKASDFLASTGQVSHTTAIFPDSSSPSPALGIWPLTGKDLQIGGALPRNLSLDPTFGTTADLDVLLHGSGAASSQCLAGQPPPARLVGGRFSLTSGILSVSTNIGVGDNWVFDIETAHPTSGTPAVFAQELKYDYFTSTPTNFVTFESGPMGGLKNETLKLTAGAVVAISQLCPIDLGPVTDERDFLAYYSLLANPAPSRIIPHRLPGPIRIGVSACPPMTTYA